MKVLIVRLSAIGDVVQGIPCLVALKESFPDWEISWLVEETSAPILKGHPYLKRLFILKRNWRTQRSGFSSTNFGEGAANIWHIRKCLRQESFDVAIDLQGLFKSGLWSWLSGAPRRLGHNKTREFAHFFLNEFVGDRPTFDPDFPLVQRYLEPARYLGADVSKGRYLLPPSSPEIVAQVDSLLGFKDSSRPLIALCPWSLWPSKNWPLERWKEVAVSLSHDFRVLVMGMAADQRKAETLASSIPHVLNLTGKTPLALLPEIFRRCRLVMGPDSGPVHLANATLQSRILMIFGSTSKHRSGPWGEGHRAVALDLSCQPCFERCCPHSHSNCLQLLDSKEVLQIVYGLVADKTPSRS